MTIYVFLGPSLARQDAEKILDATYLPPVAMGDLYNLVQQRAQAGDVVLIIDGVFEQVPAVWHKEILYALHRGLHVYGASSMGALRAAELQAFGMRGLGEIFHWYHSGEINDDDEVAVVHAPAENGFRSLSEALVNIRAAVREALNLNIISATLADFLLSQAKSLFYPDRSWPALLDKMREHPQFCACTAPLREFLQARKPNQKREDAIAALHHLAATPPSGLPFKAEFDFEETSFWIGLTRTAAQRRTLASTDALDTTIIAHLKTDLDQWQRLRDQGLICWLMDRLGDELQISADDYREQLQRFCRAEKLPSATALNTWLTQRKLTQQDLTAQLQYRAKWQLLLQRYAPEIEYFTAIASKWDGSYQAAAQHAQCIQQTLHHLGLNKPSLQQAGIDAEGLQLWYEKKIQRTVNFSEEALADMGFASVRELINLLLAQYIHETRISTPSNNLAAV